jgi:predicted phosphodiesterase
MINILKFENINMLAMMGDIHGDFNTPVYKTTYQYKMENSVTIVCGDIGIGFGKEEYYIQTFNKLNKKLSLKNNHLVFFRGNHDDAEYFNNPQKNKIFTKFSHIHVIPDYTVIEINNSNILCVGGATSIDRLWRIEEENKKYGKKTYWENEVVVFDKEKLDEINKLYPCNIQIICSHTCPSYCCPKIKEGLNYWLLKDNQLSDDLDKERKTMDEIFAYLEEGGNVGITHVYYGHYHRYNRECINNINFILLDCNQLQEHKLPNFWGL